MRGLASRLGFGLLVLAVHTGMAAELPVTEQNASVERLKTLGREYQRAGEPLMAAAAYERLVEKDPTTRMVVCPLLVQIYAKAGQRADALKWAKDVIQRNPDPQAYLAGVHAMLGEYDEAKSILKKEIAAEKHARRNLTLYWQLADVHEDAAEFQMAEQALRNAMRFAENDHERKATERRIESVRRKRAEHDAKPAAPEAEAVQDSGVPGVSVTPLPASRPPAGAE
ncbi:MAG: hypothetical protein JXR37_32910 [Kiritimatiellae bacterium]|nr:hypothetical protein [Kiritimatiellia bacterium]